MRTVFFSLFVTLSLGALLTFFFIQTQVMELKNDEQRVSNAIVNFQELNTRIFHRIDQTRFGIIQNYDSLNRDMNSLEGILNKISVDINAHLKKSTNNQQFVQILERLKDLLFLKQKTIEKYKSNNAVLNNSVAYFNSEAKKLSDALLTAKSLSDQTRQEAGDLLHGTILQVSMLSRSAEHDAMSKLLTRVNRLHDLTANIPEPLKQQFIDIILHIRLITEYNDRVSQIVNRISEIPLHSVSMILAAEHQQCFSYLMDRSNIYRTYLFAFSLVLLAAIIMMFIQLKTGAKRLETMNEELEREVTVRESIEQKLRRHKDKLEDQVKKRTQDLVKANKQLSYEIDQQIKSKQNLLLLTRAVEAASEGIIVSSGPYPDVGIIYANPAFTELTGYHLSEIKNKNCAFLQGPDTNPETIKALRKAIKAGTPIRTTILNYTKDGVQFWNDLNINPIIDDDGNITNFVGIQKDITELKQIHERLFQAKIDAEQANRAKSDFLATMSHEIRTPMNAIIGMGDLLEKANLTEDERVYLKTMQRAGDNLLRLINDILDLSKIESGKLELESAPFNLHALLKQTCRLIEVKTQEKQLELSIKIAENVPEYVIGDAARLRQILINLLGNAVKFTEKGAVRLVVIKESDQAEIALVKFTIADSGIGIDEKQQQQIFNAFTQADTSVTRKHGGTGLGLSICKRLAELLGGTINVKSQPGRGSMFYFTAKLEILSDTEIIARLEGKPSQADQAIEKATIPDSSLDKSEKEPAREKPAETTVPGTDKPISLLLVEDNMDNMLLIKAFLKKTPYAIVHAENGEKAYEQIKKRHFDIVLMDMQMPVMDGYTATRLIRELEEAEGRKRLTIIAFTAHALVGDKDKCLTAGCDDHLTKPIKKKALLEMLDKYNPKETMTA